MSRYEQSGIRDLGYSGWHREQPDGLDMIDIDGCEYCRRCGEPLALVETVCGDGAVKVTRVMERLAARAHLPAYLVAWGRDANGLVSIVRWRVVAPIRGPWEAGNTWSTRLLGLRSMHGHPVAVKQSERAHA